MSRARYEPLPQIVSTDVLGTPSLQDVDSRVESRDEELPAFSKFNALLDQYLDEKAEGQNSGDESDEGEGDVQGLQVGDGDGTEELEKGLSGASWRSGKVSKEGIGCSLFPRSALIRRIVYAASGAFVLIFVILAGGGSAGIRTANRYRGKGLKDVSFDHVMNGTFAPRRKDIRWLREAGDGVHAERNETGVFLVDVESNTTRTLFLDAQLRDREGHRLNWVDFSVSSDLRYALVNTDREKVWRWSSRSNFWIYDTESEKMNILVEPSRPPNTSFARWSPTGHALAYVHASDLYILPSPTASSPIRLTTTGNTTLFHGLCDWVYEEEVFGRPDAVWWSPDAKKLAWITFDETDVPEYAFPVYNTHGLAGGEKPYTKETVMRYPKPDFPNPRVSLRVFDLARYEELSAARGADAVRGATFDLEIDGGFPDEDRLVTEVAWITAMDLIVTQTNRVSTHQKTAHFDVTNLAAAAATSKVVGKVVRDVDWEKRDGGWFEPTQKIVSLDPAYHVQSGQNAPADLAEGYLDVIPDVAGFVHVALFSPPDAGEPVFLTKGEWEVDGAIQGIDLEKRLVYFIAAKPSTERHLFSVPLPPASQLASLRASSDPPPPTALTDTSARGAYSTAFSPFARYYLLSYLGPEAPWQKLLKTGDKAFEVVVEENTGLRRTLSEFAIPRTSWFTLKTADGQEMNAMEIRPVNMDDSGRTKYPVLVRVYGGPNSQMVNSHFDVSWSHHLASPSSSHYRRRPFVILVLDGRGTGWKGRGFRSGVRGKLGGLEVDDVVEGVRGYVAGRGYVDAARVGIWGWSYGGYLTAKVIEANSTVFSLGVAVAPVTDWRFYDSVYTERYMGLPSRNRKGYDESGVVRMDGFRRASFALAHGSGDDNVHFLNSATLLDRLTEAGVRGFRFRLFVDSNHQIYTRNAYPELMAWMESFLVEKWGSQAGPRTPSSWGRER